MKKLFLLTFSFFLIAQINASEITVNNLVGRTAIWDNARCFNALMWRLGFTKAPFGAGERSIRLLAQSEFVEEIKWEDTKLQYGDVCTRIQLGMEYCHLISTSKDKELYKERS